MKQFLSGPTAPADLAVAQMGIVAAKVEDSDEASDAEGNANSPAAKDNKAEKPAKNLKNASNTDWDTQEFRIDASFKMKIASWNISGLRAWLEKGGKDYLLHEHPDIVCLQETKCKSDSIPAEATVSGRFINSPHQSNLVDRINYYFNHNRLPPVLAWIRWTGGRGHLFSTDAVKCYLRNRRQGDGRGRPRSNRRVRDVLRGQCLRSEFREKTGDTAKAVALEQALQDVHSGSGQEETRHYLWRFECGARGNW